MRPARFAFWTALSRRQWGWRFSRSILPTDAFGGGTLLVGNIGLAAAGLFFSGRHVWLQRQPLDEAAGCLNNAAADSMLEIIRRAFDAHGDCGAVYWQFAGMSIPEQTLLMFLALAALAGWQAVAGWNQ